MNVVSESTPPPSCSPDICGWVETVPSGGVLDGFVWACEDDCNCCEAHIRWSEPHPHGGRQNLRTLWQGTYYIDGEGWDAVFTDLNHIRQHLRRHHHDLYVRINWQ